MWLVTLYMVLFSSSSASSSNLPSVVCMEDKLLELSMCCQYRAKALQKSAWDQKQCEWVELFLLMLMPCSVVSV